MKSLKQLATILGVLLLTSAANAQEKYQLQLHGSAYSTNESGGIVKKTFTHKTLIQDCIEDLGLTNRPKLMLVYKVNGDLNGDVIEVIGSRTGQVFCEKLKLLFPVTLGGEGTDSHQLVYVFSDLQAEEVGRGVVHKVVTRNGRMRISGTLNFYLPEGSETRICKVSFTTSKLVTITD